ncbi:MAG: hypothetical protein IJ599_02890 [Alphaproteobacteria bacterium]|nr:hypothetical protein [Alphaproteobacteria bacterium]
MLASILPHLSVSKVIQDTMGKVARNCKVSFRN